MIKNNLNNKLRPIFYGFGELGTSSIDIFLKVYLLLYFNNVLGLSASWTSLAIGASVLWDAAIDPWIGIYSDDYYRKHGNRKGILYFATGLICIFFVLLWRINTDHQWLTLTLLFFTSSFLNSAISLFSVPFYAIANDLEHDNEKRKIWIGSRLINFNLGSFLGLSVPALLLTNAEKTSQSQPYLDSVYVLTIVTLLACGFSTYIIYRQKDREPVEPEYASKTQTLAFLLKDKKFLQIISAFFIVNCGLGLNSTLALYYYKLYLEFTESQTQTVLVAFLVIFTLSIPIWVLLTKYFSKQRLIVVSAALLGSLTILAFPHFKGVDFWVIAAIASGVCGILIGVAVVLEIFLSDFLKEKEESLKQIVSGQYLGLWKMSSKISRAVAIALAGPIIDASVGNPQLLANYFGGVVGFFFLLSAAIMMIRVDYENEKS